MARDKSVNIWQTGIFIFIIIFANKVLLLPSLLYRDANVEGIFCYLILFLLEIGLIFLFIVLKSKFPNVSFASLVKEKFGIVTLKIIYFLLIIFFFCKLILIYNVTYIFFKDLIYKENDTIIFLVCFLPIINYLAFVGLRVLGRTCQLFFPLILIIALFCVIISFIGISSTPLFYQSNVSEVLISSLKHISSFGDVIFLYLFMDKIDYKKGDGKKLVFFALSAMILIILMAIAFYFSYTYTSFMHQYAIFEVMGNIKDYGGLGRIDVIAVILIIFLTYFQMGIYLKCFTESFNVLLPKLHKQYALITFDILFVIIVELIIRNLERTILYGESILPYLSIISFVIIPLCSIIFLIIKRRGEKWKERKLILN